MVKIKDIRERLMKNPEEYLEIKLTIAKRTLAFFFFLYYTAFLFTVWGFSFFFVTIEMIAALTFHFYSILVIVMAWFLFSLIEYIQYIYFPTRWWIMIIGLFIAILFGIIGLWAHLIHFIV